MDTNMDYFQKTIGKTISRIIDLSTDRHGKYQIKFSDGSSYYSCSCRRI